MLTVNCSLYAIYIFIYYINKFDRHVEAYNKNNTYFYQSIKKTKMCTKQKNNKVDKRIDVIWRSEQLRYSSINRFLLYK